MDPSPTLPTVAATGSAIQMRASIGADLATARRIIEQSKSSVPFASLDPTSRALFGALAEQAASIVTRMQALVVDATFLPRDDGDEAA
jgi:hypothetical protein